MISPGPHLGRHCLPVEQGPSFERTSDSARFAGISAEEEQERVDRGGAHAGRPARGEQFTTHLLLSRVNGPFEDIFVLYAPLGSYVLSSIQVV